MDRVHVLDELLRRPELVRVPHNRHELPHQVLRLSPGRLVRHKVPHDVTKQLLALPHRRQAPHPRLVALDGAGGEGPEGAVAVVHSSIDPVADRWRGFPERVERHSLEEVGKVVVSHGDEVLLRVEAGVEAGVVVRPELHVHFVFVLKRCYL